MASIKELQQQLLQENLEKYNTEAERRTKKTMDALEGAADNMSDTGKMYFEMLSKTVEASEKANSSQLSYATNRIDRIRENIAAATDLSDAEKQALQDQINVINKTFAENTSTQSSMVEKLQGVLSDNAVDITSIVAGITSNNPAIMFATKWIGDTIQKRKEEKMEMQRAIDEAASSVEVPSGKSAAVEQLEQANATLAGQREDNQAWRDDQDAEAYMAAEDRRENARFREDQIEALDAIAAKDTDVNVEVEGEGGGGLMDSILGALGIKGLGAGLAGAGSALAGAIAAALPIASIAGGLGMAMKDGFDLGTAFFDDDIATEIEGQDIGGVAGSAIGGAIGFALGGPIGAGIGMMVGNFIGEAIGDAFDPNTSQMLTDSKNQIADRGKALVESMQAVEQLYADGVISQQEYEAARRELQAEIDAANDLAIEAERVTELEAARTRAAQNYNNLNAQIERMEEAGIAVPQSMYDQLEKAEQAFNDADAAFDQASIELDEKLNPSWWSTMSTSISDAVGEVAETLKTGIDSARNSLTSLALPDVEAMTAEERADLQAKVDALPEGLKSVAGLTSEQLVLLADDLEISPEELAEMDSAAVLRATTMDSITDGITNIGTTVGNAYNAIGDALDETYDAIVTNETVNKIYEFGTTHIENGIDAVGTFVQDKVQAIGDTLWAGAEKLGIDDELLDASAFVKQKLDEVTAKASAYWENAKAKFTEITGKVGDWWDSGMSFLGFGDDEEEPEVQPSNVDTTSIEEMSTEDLRDARQIANDDLRLAQTQLRAAEQGNVTVNGERLTGDALDAYRLEKQSEVDSLQTEVQGYDDERRRRQDAARAVEDEQYQQNIAERDRLQAAIEQDSFGSVGWSSEDEKERLNTVAAAIAEYESRRASEAVEAERSRQALIDMGFAEPTTGQGLNAQAAENRDLRAEESNSGNTNIVAPTTTQINQNQTTYQPKTRIPVRNPSDDYRSYGF